MEGGREREKKDIGKDGKEQAESLSKSCLHTH